MPRTQFTYGKDFAMFAKFVFTLATTLLPGVDVGWPIMQSAEIPAELTVMAMIEPPGGPGPGRQIQFFCSPVGGTYQVGFHLAMQPHAEVVTGWVETATRDGPLILARWYAAPGEWTIVDNTTALRLQPGECFQLTYRSSGHAPVNTDQRVTYLTITR